MRVKVSALEFNKDKCFLNGDLFTGVGFCVEEARVVPVVEYKSGTELDAYQSAWFCTSEKKECLDKDALESNDGLEPFLYEGERFSGIAYDFDGDSCVGELLFENGLISEEVSFYESGAPAFYEGVNDGLEQCISWYPDGSVKQFNIVYIGDFRADINFDEQGRLKSAVLNEDFVVGIGKVKEQLKYNKIDCFGFFENIVVAPYLYLSGSAVNDEFVRYIEMGSGLDDTQKVALRNTSLSADGFTTLARSQSIEEIVVEDDRSMVTEALKGLKGKIPDCFIELNREEVLV